MIDSFLMAQEENARWRYGIIQEVMSQAWWLGVKEW